jgi:hypothetical protein
LLQEAFKAENAKAVILRLNSPGGSPVQSSRIYKANKLNKIRQRRFNLFCRTNSCAISANCSSLLRLTLSFLLLKKPNNPLIIIFLTKKYLFADVALDGLKIIDETITGDWGQKNNWPNK